MVGPLFGRIARQEAEVEFAVETLHPDQRDAGVEEDVELIYAGFEDFCEGEMPEFVGDDQKRQAGQKAEDLHRNTHIQL